MPKIILEKKSKKWTRMVCPTKVQSFVEVTNLPKKCYSSIQIADIAYMQSKTFPKIVFRLKNVEILRLNFNQFTKLPKEIGTLKRLVSLDLFSNELITLPKEISVLKNLVELDIGQNKLQVLPDELGSLPKLKYLRVDYNPELDQLPQPICEKIINGQIAPSRILQQLCSKRIEKTDDSWEKSFNE